MAVSSERSWTSSDADEDKVLSLCKIIPFWTPSNSRTSCSTTSSFHSSVAHQHVQAHRLGSGQDQIDTSHGSVTVSSLAKSLLPPRRRLRLEPSNKLYFPYEPGKQAKSAISIKNICKTSIAFKFQTTAPKSCYMRPPGGILAPGESVVAIVFKFMEPPERNEKPIEQRSRVKFKIMSLKVHGDQLEYTPELFDEQRDQVSVEQILRVVFLDAEHSTPAMEKLKRQLAEAEAAVVTRRKPQPQEAGPLIAGQGLVIDEWKERRERYLAQQGDATDSV